MSSPAPVICTACRPSLGTIMFAGVLRDSEDEPRCVLCGFKVDVDGERVPENDRSPPTTEG